MVNDDIKPDSNGGALKTSNDPEQFRKLFVGGLNIVTTDEALRQFYSQFGELVDCIVMRDPATKKSRGFGFVSFATQEEVDRAMAARPHVIDNKTVDPKRAVPRDQSAKGEHNISTKRLYVSGIREEHTEDALKDYFQAYGNINQAEIILDKNTGKPRGFAFVTFEDYDSVDKCVIQKSHMVNGHRCDVKKALSKEEMQKAQQMDRDRQERGFRSRGVPPRGARGGGYAGGYGGGSYGGGGGYQGGYGGGAPSAPAWGGAQGGQGSWGGGDMGYGGGGGYSGSYAGAGGYQGGYGGGGQGYGGGGQGYSGGGQGYGGGQAAGGWGGASEAQWGAGGAAGGAYQGAAGGAAGGWGGSSAGGWGGGGAQWGGGQAGAGAPPNQAASGATASGAWGRSY